MRRMATGQIHRPADDPLALRLADGWVHRRRRRTARARARRALLAATGLPDRSTLARRRLVDGRWRSDG